MELDLHLRIRIGLIPGRFEYIVVKVRHGAAELMKLEPQTAVLILHRRDSVSWMLIITRVIGQIVRWMRPRMLSRVPLLLRVFFGRSRLLLPFLDSLRPIDLAETQQPVVNVVGEDRWRR